MIKVRSHGISFLKVEFNDQTFTFYFESLVISTRYEEKSSTAFIGAFVGCALRLVQFAPGAGLGFRLF
jgi:hypothetical protein